MTGLIPALAVLLLPALIVLWVKRPRRAPLQVYTMHPVPPPSQAWGAAARTPEQRAADQARTDQAWGLR